jgi:hypothetical protein
MGHPEQHNERPLLADVLPKEPKPWYRISYLVKLNLLLLIPLMSSSVAGFDGKKRFMSLLC